MIDYMNKKDLISLLKAYDKYIQEANDSDAYYTDWRPVCIDEFYNNDYELYYLSDKNK